MPTWTWRDKQDESHRPMPGGGGSRRAWPAPAALCSRNNWMRTRRARHEHRSGQALVEFAVVLPILLLLMIGLVNLGILVNAQIVLTQAAWEGARAGDTIRDPVAGDDEIMGAVRRAG